MYSLARVTKVSVTQVEELFVAVMVGAWSEGENENDSQSRTDICGHLRHVDARYIIAFGIVASGVRGHVLPSCLFRTTVAIEVAPAVVVSVVAGLCYKAC